MKIYYYKTTKDNEKNVVLGYLTRFGDFVEKWTQNEAICFGSAFAKIMVEGNKFLTAGERLEDFFEKVAEEAREAVGLETEAQSRGGE